MSLVKTWAPYFNSGVRMHGRAYQLANRVSQLAPQPGELARSRVRGSKLYTVVIRGDGQTASAHCTCPHFGGGSYCKHIWATILDLQHNGPAGARAANATGDAQAESEADNESSSITNDAIDDGSVPPPPRARKRDPGERPTRRAEPEWMGRLTLLHPPGISLEAAVQPIGPIQRQIVYIVSPDQSVRNDGLVIELYQRQPTRAGWSKIRRLKINADSLREIVDPTDRELCALILGATWVDEGDPGEWYRSDRQRSSYKILPGARRALLKRLIDTGRCYIDVGDDPTTPLAWDDDDASLGPWVLWLVGHEEPSGDLVINVELRRAGETMAIDRPTLVLGGADGLVVYDDKAAPLDDRDAHRWVQQFREDLRRGREVEPIRVPKEDVARFLDRLYMLPQLPEIDLPDSVGRSEVHIEPVPHLELFSPPNGNEKTAPAGIGADPSLPRNQLSARVWFAYGDYRVQPGQPGRFVVTAAVGADVDATTTDAIEPDEEQKDGSAIRGGVEQSSVDMDADEGGNASGIDADSVDETGEPGETEDVDESTEQVLIRRDLRRETDAVTSLLPMGFRPDPVATEPDASGLLLPVKQMPMAVNELLRRGWVITADRRIVRNAGAPSFTIASGIDWFELRGGMRYNDQVVSLPEILAAARAGRTMITLGDGSQGILPQAWLEQHGLLTALAQVEGDHLRFKSTQAALLDALLAHDEVVNVDAQFEAARMRLREFEGVKPQDPSPTFQGELRPYQKEGLGWLAFLRWFGVGGILADDMGLGKTIQVLAMLEKAYSGGHEGTEPRKHEGDSGPASKPTLIVVPRSVVFNWLDEAAKFTPGLKVQAYTGAEREALRDAFAQQHIIVTSYGLMRRDIAELRKHEFEYLVLDEAQAIKNPSSQSAKAARVIRATHRLALTGTPVENHLGDLWSIFEFLNPGMLGSSTHFADLVRGGAAAANNGNGNGTATQRVAGNGEGNGNKNGEKTGDALHRGSDDAAQINLTRSTRKLQSTETAAQLGRALRPFILRRAKKQVLTELPEKTEQTIVCQMEPAQREVYDQLLRHYRSSLLSQVEQKGIGRSAMMVLEALLRLRQASCHPGLIDPKRADEPSAKLEALLERVEDLIDEGHKALVFSQFTSMLALVRKRLDERGIIYEYLDGQTRHRRRHVQRFQTDPRCPLFLISLKAGGLGLNLTAAEYVFILDPWWNPAVEAQAIDRAHRIGQTRHVFAYRLICENTVEQRIAELQTKKKQLADAIIGGQENLLRSLTREDLETLLS